MNRVCHFEIHATDPEKLIPFYAELFGWKFTKWSGPWDYWLITTGPNSESGINGGLHNRFDPVEGTGVIAFVCTVEVADIDQKLEKATSLGARITVPKREIPGVGWMAYFRDPDQNMVGLLQPNEEE
jgi:uncharacterized protein